MHVTDSHMKTEREQFGFQAHILKQIEPDWDSITLLTFFVAGVWIPPMLRLVSSATTTQ